MHQDQDQEFNASPYNPYAWEAYPQNYDPIGTSSCGLNEGGICEADYLAAAVVSNSALIPYAGTEDEIAARVYDIVEAMVRERQKRKKRYAEDAARFRK